MSIVRWVKHHEYHDAKQHSLWHPDVYVAQPSLDQAYEAHNAGDWLHSTCLQNMLICLLVQQGQMTYPSQTPHWGGVQAFHETCNDSSGIARVPHP